MSTGSDPSLLGDSQIPVTPGPEGLTPFPGLCKHLSTHEYMYTETQVHMLKREKNPFKLYKCLCF